MADSVIEMSAILYLRGGSLYSFLYAKSFEQRQYYLFWYTTLSRKRSRSGLSMFPVSVETVTVPE